jgi:hypothetical protein
LVGPVGIAVSGSNLFVTNCYNNTIGEYTTSGAVVNASLVSGSGLADPGGIAVSGSDLFVANWNTGTISEYTTSGAVVNPSLISGLAYPVGVAVSGDKLYVTNLYADTIGEYTTSGAVVNASLISGLSGNPWGIAVAQDVPEPSSAALLFSFVAVGSLGLLAFTWRRQRRTA